jgi:hypothetical protein
VLLDKKVDGGSLYQNVSKHLKEHIKERIKDRNGNTNVTSVKVGLRVMK